VTLQVSSEVQKLVTEQIASGRFADANDVLLDALKRQRQVQEGEGGFEDDWPAIAEALDEIEAGDQGRPAEEVFAELRHKHSL
jgi:Arc/MetJ-type ribon-helix-helix transcriptional regulator